MRAALRNRHQPQKLGGIVSLTKIRDRTGEDEGARGRGHCNTYTLAFPEKAVSAPPFKEEKAVSAPLFGVVEMAVRDELKGAMADVG